MKPLITVSVTLLNMILVGGIKIGTTLSDCKAIASQFKNTCPGAPDSPADWNTF